MKEKGIKQLKKIKKLKASALLSAILVLMTCVIFTEFYIGYFYRNLHSNLLLLKYFL